MTGKINFDEHVFLAAEIKDLVNGTVEWFQSEREWLDTFFTMVNQQHPYSVTENVRTLKLSVLDLKDPQNMKRFREMGGRSTVYFMSLPKIKRLLDDPIHNYVYIEGVGELSDEEIQSLREWLETTLK